MTITNSIVADEKKLDTITFTIDGKKVEAPRGTTVLEAARSADIYIPTLCYDPDLKPYGACCLCVVEIDGMRGLPTSCTTPATDGMVVHTETHGVNQSRRISMELIMANHHGVALVVIKQLASEVRRLSDMVESLALHTVRSRLARFLLARADGTLPPRRWTQEEIAGQIGTVREIVGRTLRRLASDGLIRRERGRITIVDLEGLREEAAGG